MQEGSIATVDYQTVQNRTLPVIASEIITIEKQVEQTALIGAIEIGHRLNEAKELCQHGEFGSWCKENLDYSQRKAERFMKLSEEYNAGNWLLTNSTISSKVSVFKALSLLALPDEEAKTFVEGHDIEAMSVKSIDEEIKKLKEEKDRAIASAESLKRQKDRADAELAQNEQAMEEMQNHITQLKAEIRIMESEQAPAVDVTEYEEKIDKLNTAIEKAKEKECKLKDRFKQLESSKQEDIDEAVAAQRESLYEQVKAEHSVEIEHLNEINVELQTEVDGLRKKLQNNSEESKLRFKILVDQLQDTFNECINLAADEEEETAIKMRTALQTVLISMSEVLG